jgi:sugar lactone lactonase YvrE
MRDWRVLALALSLVGCGHGQSPPPTTSECTGLCTPSHLTTLDLVAGQPGGPGWVDGTLAAAHFASPWTMARDGNGHLFVADGQMIRTIDMNAGTVTTLVGVFHLVAGGTDGVGPQATFNVPSGLAYANGQLYVTDTENHAIRKIDVKSATSSTIAGQIGSPGAIDAVGTAARFREPEGLAIDSSGNLYIGDTDNDTIRMLALSTGAVTTIAGTAGMAGATDGVGAAARFNKPKGLTLDGKGNVYVIDNVNLSIRKIVLATATVSTLTTFTTPPQGVAVDGADVLVTDGSERVVRVAADGTVTSIAGATGMQGYVDGAPTTARFSTPAGLLNDGAGTLYVVDNLNAVIRTIALPAGTVGTYAGARSAGSSDGTGTEAHFSSPQGIAADADNAYVADTNNQTIRKVVVATGAVTTLSGVAGQQGHTEGPVAGATFNEPSGVALDGAGHKLYVADANNRCIRLIDLAAGTVSTPTFETAPGAKFYGFNSPVGVAFDRGTLYVADFSNNLVDAIDLGHGLISVLAGHPEVGAVDGIGAQAGFYGPQSVAADGQGNLYVADNQSQTVRKIVIATATVTTEAGHFSIPGSNDGAGSDARFSFPTGVAANAVGDLFVSDLLNNTVRHVDLSSDTVTTVIGSTAVWGVRTGPLPAQVTQPTALALLPSGGLLLISENALLLAH